MQQVSHSFALAKVSSARQSARSRRTPVDRAVLDWVYALHAEMDDTLPQPAPPPMPHIRADDNEHSYIERNLPAETMPPPPPPVSADEHDDSRSSFDTRSTRSTSSASRNTNRLSLTLPIAPPTAYPTRPTPTSSVMSSYPPTPIETSNVTSPTDSNDFIIAIAAQERRVLELREDLKSAEAELTRLKKQWAQHEAYKKRHEIRKAEPLRTVSHQTPTADGEDSEISKRSVELDRRKALLLGQASNQGTPNSGRRRVIRGGHTRALSLLSPTKTEDGFAVHEDTPEGFKPLVKDSEPHFQHLARTGPVTPAQLAKRASWAPRSVRPANPSGVKQIAEDFKAGLWTFVEDLRQATVGDEPINGGGIPTRGIDGHIRSGSRTLFGEDQDTIRASTSNARPHVANAFSDTPTPASRFTDVMSKDAEGGDNKHQRSSSKAFTKANKRFSWTPLTVDSYDDNDWSNWDSPTVNSPRWSGTTVNGDIIPSIPEKSDENGTPLKKMSSAEDYPFVQSPSALKLEELSLGVLNKLTPGNIKRTASDFMKEWEKSLSPPPEPVGFGSKEKGM